jgi:hypothetical protein
LKQCVLGGSGLSAWTIVHDREVIERSEVWDIRQGLPRQNLNANIRGAVNLAHTNKHTTDPDGGIGQGLEMKSNTL